MKPKLFMMIGLPGSGKSEKTKLLEKKYNASIHSSDEIRLELSSDENNQSINSAVFQELHKRIKKDLLQGKNTIYDATNISYKARKGFLSELNRINCKKIAVLIATSYEDCLRNNAVRDRQVPEEAIKKMYLSFYVPYWHEGWDDIKVVYNSPRNKSYKRFVSESMRTSQDNSHHELSLGEHLEKSGIFISDRSLLKSYDSCFYAAVLHDCGKPFTKCFKNAKGEKSKDAHYYSHNNCGAYDSLFFKAPVSPLNIAVLILWHMQPYFWEKDGNASMLNKYLKIWGDSLYAKVILVHAADVSAH